MVQNNFSHYNTLLSQAEQEIRTFPSPRYTPAVRQVFDSTPVVSEVKIALTARLQNNPLKRTTIEDALQQVFSKKTSIENAIIQANGKYNVLKKTLLIFALVELRNFIYKEYKAREQLKKFIENLV